jgi:hypothetical protein
VEEGEGERRRKGEKERGGRNFDSDALKAMSALGETPLSLTFGPMSNSPSVL